MIQIDKNRILQYFNGSSKEDEDYIATSFLNEKNEAEIEAIARKNWQDTPSSKVDLQHVLNRIHFQINTYSTIRTAKGKLIAAYSRVAAILLIPLLIGSIYMLSQTLNQVTHFAEISAPRGSRIQFTLPDGTHGFLNGGSSLKYPTNFTKRRQIELIGEGYFEVKKDEKHPFTVQTHHADIRVLGTKFDVCAYKRDQEVITTLEEGSVQVLNKKRDQRMVLHPGEQNRINTITGEMKSQSVKTNLYTSWKENMLRFNNTPFAEVVKKMERWYGVKIVLDKSLQYSENYTMTIRTESLRELLELLKITTPMEYEIKQDTVYIHKLNKTHRQKKRGKCCERFPL